MPIQVSDTASNPNEQIDHAADVIGRSGYRRLVFEAIHFHKSSVKSVSEIMKRSGLDRDQVLKAGRSLVNAKLITQETLNGEVAYRKNDFLQHNKAKVLKLAGDPVAREAYPTKRNPVSRSPISIRILPPESQAEQITIDDIASFKNAWGSKASAERLPRTLSEEEFKIGIKRILGEPGEFKDWGGENSDLTSTRLLVAGRRRPVAFAFKGPGLNAKLTPGKMGKNGDQIQRLFYTAAEVFLVQHWREIADSVPEQLRTFAAMRSNMLAKKVWYGTIDGADSRRIYEAYPRAFE